MDVCCERHPFALNAQLAFEVSGLCIGPRDPRDRRHHAGVLVLVLANTPDMEV